MADVDVKLYVNGKIYGGWKTVQIAKSIRAFSSSFQLDVTDNWTGIGEVKIRAGDECRLSIGDKVIITGFVDAIDNAVDAQSQTITVNGRDKTADLIDCSAIFGSGEFKNCSLFDIAKYLSAPFGINVILDADVDAGAVFENFSLQQGESAFEALSRGAKLRGKLWSTDGLGNLVLTKAGKTRASGALILGENIKSISVTEDIKERFSEYIVKAQVTGSDSLNGVNAAQVKARAIDNATTRRRPLIILAEDQAKIADAQKRAEWEAKTRAANAVAVTVKTAGFEQDDKGRLWDINELVPIKSDLHGLDEELLIADITMTLDDAGSNTELKLVRPDAFLTEPIISKENEPAQKL